MLAHCPGVCCLPATAQPLVRLDHIPTAVHDLARVVAD